MNNNFDFLFYDQTANNYLAKLNYNGCILTTLPYQMTFWYWTL